MHAPELLTFSPPLMETHPAAMTDPGTVQRQENAGTARKDRAVLTLEYQLRRGWRAPDQEPPGPAHSRMEAGALP